MKHILSILLAFSLLCGSLMADASRVLLNAGAPVNGTSEVQTLTIGGSTTGGTFKLTFDGHTTGAITWSATTNTLLANINAALDALPNLEASEVVATDSTLSSGNGAILLTFGGNRAKLNVNAMTVTNSLTGGTHTLAVTTSTPGVDATHRDAPLGALLVNTTNKTLYQNRGTSLNPTWTEVVGVAVTDSASVAAMVDDETGSGLLVFATSPTLTTPVIGAATGTSLALSGAITATGGTLTTPVLSGSVTGTYTLAGTPTITAPAISAPVLSGTATGTYTLAGTPTITAPTITSAIVTPRYTAATADGAITIASGVVTITKGSIAALTLAAPSAQNGTRITIVSGTDFAHVVTCPGAIILDGTDGANTTATFPAFAGASVTLIASGVTWLVESVNAVTLAP